tara:strand:- start:2921 stop:3238 length:318 start_codon:yes stop_codon:yes gene_type:complete
MRQTSPADAPSTGVQESAAPVETVTDHSEPAHFKNSSDAEWAEETAPWNETLVTWSRVVGDGESLDTLLSKAGLDTFNRPASALRRRRRWSACFTAHRHPRLGQG